MGRQHEVRPHRHRGAAVLRVVRVSATRFPTSRHHTDRRRQRSPALTSGQPGSTTSCAASGCWPRRQARLATLLLSGPQPNTHAPEAAALRSLIGTLVGWPPSSFGWLCPPRDRGGKLYFYNSKKRAGSQARPPRASTRTRHTTPCGQPPRHHHHHPLWWVPPAMRRQLPAPRHRRRRGSQQTAERPRTG